MVYKILLNTLRKLVMRLVTKVERSERRKKVFAVFVLIVYLLYKTQYNFKLFDGKNKPLMKPSMYMKDVKRILYWNTQLGLPNWAFGVGRQPFKDMACKFQNCEFWESQDQVYNLPPEEFDAIIFQCVAEDFDAGDIALPAIRRPEQRYIYYNFEGPSYHKISSELYKNFFNWTLTHRRDSDIYSVYGIFANLSIANTNVLPGPEPEKWPEPFYHNMTIPDFVYGKTKLIAWFNSDVVVPSNRRWYIEELAHYVDIDVYGAGGTHTCIPAFTNCNEFLENHYKFYLAFENALCTDYLTEKVFRTLQTYVVPIVYGGEGYKAAAPPMSYIDVQDYESPAHLVEYLLYLDKNPEEYAKYFWWKPYYEYIGGERLAICTLCEKLNDPTEPKKVYADVGRWWNEGICHTHYEHFQAVSDKWVIGDKRRYFNLVHAIM